MSDILMEVRNLSVEFKAPGPGFFGGNARLKAVQDLSFQVQKGETLGIVGESGCGKSTLGRAILHLIPPTSGSVLWRGKALENLSSRALRALRSDVQIIFQDPLAALNPRMSVGESLAEPLITHKPTLSRAAVHRSVCAMMDRVGLRPEHINRYPHDFSGGQCQRIGIARAMILNPKLVVCDEAVSALDVSIQAQIINLLVELQKESGLSLIFMSHNLSVVRYISQRIMVLYLGKIMELGLRDQICNSPQHPYTQALIASVPSPDPRQDRRRTQVALSGDLPSPLAPPSGCVFRTRCPRAENRCARDLPTLEEKQGRAVACHLAKSTGQP